MKKIIVLIFAAFFFTNCSTTLHSDSYWTKKGRKWNDYTNGKMKCKNNANPTGKFNK